MLRSLAASCRSFLSFAGEQSRAKENKRERDFNFSQLTCPATAGAFGVKFGCLFDNDVGEAFIGADGRRIK